MRTEQFANLQGGDGDAAANPPDQHVLTGAEIRARHDHAPRGEGGKAERGGDVDWSRRGNRTNIQTRHDDIFREGSRQVLAENPESHAQRLLAVATVFAGAIANTRIDDDRVADRHVAHLLASGIYDSRPVGAEYPTGSDVDARKTAHDEEVEVVERRRAHPNPDIGRPPDRRHRQIVSQLELVQSAMSRDGQAFHNNGTVIFRSFNQGILTSPAHGSIVGAAPGSDDINQGASAR